MMYFINLTLQAPEEQYPALLETIKAIGSWSNRLRGCWLVESRMSARQIRDILKAHLKSGDRIFVGQMTRNWAATNMGEGFPEWMERRAWDANSRPAAAPEAPKA